MSAFPVQEFAQSEAAGSPVGPPVDPRPARLPNSDVIHGRVVVLEPLSKSHVPQLCAELAGPGTDNLWTYMFDGPFASPAALEPILHQRAVSRSDPYHYTVMVNGEPKGTLSLMRVEPNHRVCEIGHVTFSKSLQRTVAATEAFYLLLRHAFDALGYRRLEWKCNKLNAPSVRAAYRLGYVFEGIFRNHYIIKGHSRDTAWFSIVEGDEWSKVKGGLEAWLAEENFDEAGRQKRRLEDLRADC